MKNNIVPNDMRILQNAIMEFPTWDLFNDYIVEASNNYFPSTNFGNKPMRCPNKTIISITGTSKLKSIIGGNKFIGIDVPVLLKSEGNDNKGTICIVGESPLRNIKDFKNSDNILLGTPYAVHQEFGSPSQCDVYKKIINNLLAAGYSVYLTDIVKIWWKGKDMIKDKDVDENFLEKELEKIGKNVFIVTWGKRASDKFSKMNIDYLPLLHPGKRNWDNWKLKIFMKAVYDEGVDYAKNLYPCKKGSPTTEFIVANEAVKEILDYCNKS